MAGKAHFSEPEAFELYKNKTDQNEIARIVGVSEQTISNWKKKFKWDEKVKAYSASARKSIDILDRIIRDKLAKVEFTEVDQLPKGFEDGLFKLQLMREKMNTHQDRRQQTIDIMGDLNEFLVHEHPEHVELFHELLPEFISAQGRKYHGQ